MTLNLKTIITQVIETTDKVTGEKQYYVEKDGEWHTITCKDYKKLIRGEQQ
ncbi:MAG: hypothetical protein IKF82_00040 [Bacilli bacterium]|nr:hypothetical protein [Bacilli bacterium]